MEVVTLHLPVPSWVLDVVRDMSLSTNANEVRKYAQEVFFKGVAAECDAEGDMENRAKIEALLERL